MTGWQPRWDQNWPGQGSSSRCKRFRSARTSRGDLITQVSVLFEQLVQNVFQFGGHAAVQLNRRYRSAMQNVPENDRTGRAREGQGAGHHLIDHGAQGKKIAAGVQRFAASLSSGDM